MAPKSPPWTREEIVLALDLYYRFDRRIPGPGDPAVNEVSRYLNQLPIHDRSVRAANFRNPAGVSLKIANLRTFDRSTASVGMSGGSRLDKAVYEEFEDQPLLVAGAAQDILRRYGLIAAPPSERQMRRAAESPVRFDVGFDPMTRHMTLEQDKIATRARMDAASTLTCEVCGFDFGRTYGSRGRGYIQFHHRSPLAELSEQTRPGPGDLHMICANCHTMLHTGELPITLDDLKAIVRAEQRAGLRDLASRIARPEF